MTKGVDVHHCWVVVKFQGDRYGYNTDLPDRIFTSKQDAEAHAQVLTQEGSRRHPAPLVCTLADRIYEIRRASEQQGADRARPGYDPWDV